MFESELEKWDDFDFLSFFRSINDDDIRRVLKKDKITSQDLMVLLSPKALTHLEEMASKSREITLRQFGRTVQLYTPLYLSNHCTNGCLYCGFNFDNKMLRTKLSLKELESEAKEIAKSGLKHILILTGGDRKETDLEYIKDCIAVVKKYFDSVSIEMYSMTEKEYEEIVDSGVNNVTIYQETYERDLYKKLHRFGEKSNYSFRLGAPERAASMGVQSVNMGVLLGLDDPATEFFKTSIHCEYIRKNFPSTSIAVSFPRIRPAIGGFQPPFMVSDAQLVQFITAFRLFMPRGEISISTRESAELRDNLLPLGVTKMSAGSVTSVGSRSKEEETKKQFEISDCRSAKELSSDLEKMGYQPVQKDWEIV